jgi:phosphate/sulfate permease
MPDLIPILQALSVIFGLIGVYLALAQGVDLYNSLFRGVVIYALFTIIGLIMNYLFLLMVKRAQERKMAETKRIEKEKAETQRA